MKIGIDLRTLQEGKQTGVEIYLQSLLAALLERDRDNQYVLFYNSRTRALSGLPKSLKSNVKVAAYRWPNRLLNLSLWLFRYPKIDRLLGGLDVFLSPRYIFTALSKKCPLAVVIHDLSFVHFPEFFSIKHRLWHAVVSDKGACKKARAVITDSQSTKKDVQRIFGISGEKISVVYPGLDHDRYHPANDPASRQSLINKYALAEAFVLYLGTIEPRKNILGVISAFDELKSRSEQKLQLVIAGGLGWLYGKVITKVKNSPNKKDIKLLGQVEEKEKPELYRMAKVTLFPSFFEGFGFPPLESMACGTPVVAADNSSFREVLGDAALYVNPFDSSQIAAAVKGLISEPGLSDAYSKRGIARAKNFSWKRSASEIFEILKTLV